MYPFFQWKSEQRQNLIIYKGLLDVWSQSKLFQSPSGMPAIKYSGNQLRMQLVHLEPAALIYHQAGESMQKPQS